MPLCNSKSKLCPHYRENLNDCLLNDGECSYQITEATKGQNLLRSDDTPGYITLYGKKIKPYLWLLQKKRGRCSLVGGQWSTVYSNMTKSKVNKKLKKMEPSEREKCRILPLYRLDNLEVI